MNKENLKERVKDKEFVAKLEKFMKNYNKMKELLKSMEGEGEVS